MQGIFFMNMNDEPLEATDIWTYPDFVEITTFCRVAPDPQELGRWVILDRSDVGIYGLGDCVAEAVLLDDGRNIPRFDDYGHENYLVAFRS